MIIPFVIVALMFDSRVTWNGEIRCWSLLEVKGLTYSSRWSGTARVECVVLNTRMTRKLPFI